MKQILTTIVANDRLCDSLYRLDLCLNDHSITPLPGQFFTARINDTFSPLLRRPFAFSAFDRVKNQISFIYQIRGQGTSLLSAMKTNDTLDIIGPLGIPFTLPPKDKNVVLIAGGIGLGPIQFLASSMQQNGGNFIFVFGCRTASLLPVGTLDSFSPIVCTDDGTFGFHGSVIDYLESSAIDTSSSVIYCCGPHPMLHACHNFAIRHAIECFVSVEQTMGCGVGACMGCVVKVHGPKPYARACKEGPVFNSKDIAWE